MKRLSILLGSVLLFGLFTVYAQTTVVNLTAKSANVSEAGTPVRINILRWSTDEERLSILAALNPALAPPPAAGARGGRGGGARGGRGAAADDVAPDPALAEVDGGGGGGAARGGGGGRGGRGGGGGGRGGRGGDAAPAKPPDPYQTLAAAIGKAPTVGYVWSGNEVVGYSIKYAQLLKADGGERLILATDRRLGGFSSGWKPAGSATPTDYDFTVIDIRLDAKGAGEGKTSLASKVVVDSDAKILALENYAAAPVNLAAVKK